MRKYIQFLLLLIPAGFIFFSPADASATNPRDVLINEICTDPQQDWSTTDFNGIVSNGSVSSSDEFIELFNASNTTIDLTNWHLVMTDSGIDDATLTADLVKNEAPQNDITQFKPGMYWIIGNPPGMMNNDVKIELFDGPPATSHLIDSVTLGNFDDGNTADNAPSGNATSAHDEVVARDPARHSGLQAQDFTRMPASMGKENPHINHAPTLSADTELQGKTFQPIQFTIQKSSDEDGDPLEIAWDFDARDGFQEEAHGPSISHTFDSPGDYAVTARATDSLGASTDITMSVSIEKTIYPNGVLFSEILPDAQNKSSGFIELYNSTDTSIDISGWKMINNDTEQLFVIPEQTIVSKRTYIVFDNKKLLFPVEQLSEISLQYPSGETTSSVTISEQEKEGESYNFITGRWAWSELQTPGAANIIKNQLDNTPVSDWPSSSDPKKTPTPTPAPAPSQTVKPAESVPLASISDAKNLTQGSRVQIKGRITAIVANAKTTLFYLQDSSGGIKIYCGKKLSLPLSLGQEIQLSGKISHTTYETKLVIRAETDVSHLSSQKNVITAEHVALSTIKDEDKGKLIQIEGTFTKETNASIFISDGKTIIKIAKPTSSTARLFDAKKISQLQLSATGILEQEKGGFKLVLLEQKDVSEMKNGAGTTGTIDTAGTAGATNEQEKLLATGTDYFFFIKFLKELFACF